MSEVKHTPGPWLVDAKPDVTLIRTATGKKIAVLWASSFEASETEANARLIAAAPWLLAAAKAVSEAIAKTEGGAV